MEKSLNIGLFYPSSEGAYRMYADLPVFIFVEIAQPVGLQYNLYVNPSVRPLQVSENVHNS